MTRTYKRPHRSHPDIHTVPNTRNVSLLIDCRLSTLLSNDYAVGCPPASARRAPGSCMSAATTASRLWRVRRWHFYGHITPSRKPLCMSTVHCSHTGGGGLFAPFPLPLAATTGLLRACCVPSGRADRGVEAGERVRQHRPQQRHDQRPSLPPRQGGQGPRHPQVSHPETRPPSNGLGVPSWFSRDRLLLLSWIMQRDELGYPRDPPPGGSPSDLPLKKPNCSFCNHQCM